MMKEADKSFLWKREWIALSAFAAFLAAVMFISRIEEREKVASLLESNAGFVHVYIEGAVDNPGLYRVVKGTTLSDVLQEAGIKIDADTKMLDLTRKVADLDRFDVKAVKLISIVVVYPEGKRKSLDVPKGTKISDLALHGTLGDYRPVWKERRRKLLKQGDEITLELKKL